MNFMLTLDSNLVDMPSKQDKILLNNRIHYAMIDWEIRTFSINPHLVFIPHRRKNDMRYTFWKRFTLLRHQTHANIMNFLLTLDTDVSVSIDRRLRLD